MAMFFTGEDMLNDISDLGEEQSLFDEEPMQDLKTQRYEYKDSVSIDSVIENPQNEYAVITDDEAFRELVSSIKRNGFDSSQALKVKPRDKTTGKFMLISGHRRLAAAKEAGLTTVPVMVDNSAASYSTAEENISILEANKGYRDKNVFNEVAQIKQIKNALLDEGKTGEEVASQLMEVTGKAERTVKLYVSLSTLPNYLIDYAKTTGRIKTQDGIAIKQAVDSGKDPNKLYGDLCAIPSDIDEEEAVAQAKAIIDKFCKVKIKKKEQEEKPQKNVDPIKHLKKVEKSLSKEDISSFYAVASAKRKAEFTELIEKIESELEAIKKWFDENN